MKTSTASDLTVGGPTLAAHAFNAGLVDECHLFVCPVLVAEGKPAFASTIQAGAASWATEQQFEPAAAAGLLD
jgi:dihydrofolate reductase